MANIWLAMDLFVLLLLYYVTNWRTPLPSGLNSTIPSCWATIFLMHTSLFVTLLLAGLAYGAALTSAGVYNHWSDPYSLRPNPLYPYPRSPVAGSPRNTSSRISRFWKDSDISPSHTRPSKPWAAVLQRRQDASRTTQQGLDTRPTPEPTGKPSARTTVFISNEKDFALLLPTRPGGMFVLALCASPQSTLYQSSYPMQRQMQRPSVLLGALTTCVRIECRTASSRPPRSSARMTIRGFRYDAFFLHL